MYLIYDTAFVYDAECPDVDSFLNGTVQLENND